MNDQFLRDLRREPRPEFARRLRASLHDRIEHESASALFLRLRRWAPLAASVAIVSVAFTFPSVRAGAQAFLDFFRVTNVVGVSFNPAPLQNLLDSGLDLPALIGDPVELLTPRAEPVTVATIDEAAEAAGFDVLEPAWMPVGFDLNEIAVLAEQAARFTASTDAVVFLLDALEIDDLTVPAGLDGQEMTVRIPPVVSLSYGQPGEPPVQFLQALSPEITLPAGLDLPVLGEIALRIIGLDRQQAFELAWTIDWSGTLIVPVPLGEATFEEVDIGGRTGVAVVSDSADQRVLLWSDGERVFALAGSLPLNDLHEMAQTAQ